MISIYKSQNLKILKDQIVDHLENAPQTDPLFEQSIIVPNLDTARWLKLQIAEMTGIAANLQFLLPSEWQWNQIRKLYPDLPNLLPSDPEPMRWALFELLSDAKLREKHPVLKSYVDNHSTGRPETAVSGLSKQIASVFDQYLIYRPQMLIKWQQNKISDKEEKWQAELWKLLNKKWKRNYKDENSGNKAELYREVSDALKNGKINSDEVLFLFNPGLIPAPIVDLLKLAGNQSDLKIYLIQPADDLQAGINNELLSAFGNESVRVADLFDFEDSDEVKLFQSESQELTLQKIRKKITENRLLDSPIINKLPEDIQIRSCHSPSREVEVFYHFLLEKFEENKDLSPEDILVVTPDLEKYQPSIDAVFGIREEGLPEIPYHVGLRKVSEEEGIERAFLKLLELADSRFEYTSVMDLFGIESIRSSFGVSESEERMLRNWLDSNHVVWGADADHREEWGQPPDSLNTWRTAQSRIWLGQAAADDTGQIKDKLILFRGLDTGREKEIWASFSSFLEILNQIRSDTHIERDVQSWCKLIDQWVDRIFIDKTNKSIAAQEIKRIINNISKSINLAEISVPVSYSTIREQIKSDIKMSSAGTSSFTRGVLFTSMVPLRSIPFKIIALIGLNDGSFPRKQISPDFDLIAKYPRLSDRNRKDEDRNLFLESILSAGEVHYCSYIGQDPVDNEELAQSPVISEWVDYIASACDHKPEQVVKKEALTSFSPANFDQYSKNYSALFRDTSDKLLKSIDSVSGLSIEKIEQGAEEVNEIMLDELTSFYYNPVRHFLKSKFEISLQGTDDENDEFSLDNLQYHLQFGRIFGWKLAGKPNHEIFDILVQSGELPSGWPGMKKLNETLSLVQDAVNTLDEFEVQPETEQFEVDISLKNSSIKGIVQSYSKDFLLDISVSGKSGKILLAHWIKHLCVSLTNENFEDSFLLCNLKKKPLWLRFTKTENSEELLEEAVELYRQSFQEPKLWFPGTSFAFEESKKDGQGDAGKARTEFEGSNYKFAERDDLYIKHLLGENKRFDESFIENKFQNFVSRMVTYIEEK